MLLIVRSFSCDGQGFDAGETFSEDAVPADARKSAGADGWLVTLPRGAEPDIKRSYSASHAAAICEIPTADFLRHAGRIRIAPEHFFNDQPVYDADALALIFASIKGDRVPA